MKLFLVVAFYLFSFIASYIYILENDYYFTRPVCGKTKFFRRFSSWNLEKFSLWLININIVIE